jgi:hypothetical protein
MKKNIIHVILLALFVFALASEGLSQEKASCTPSASCGPADTKLKEAKTITELRTSLQNVVSYLSLSRYNFSEDLKTLDLSSRTTDDETLLFLTQATGLIRQELKEKLPTELQTIELKNHKVKFASTKPQMVVSVKKDIEIFKDQIARL